MSSITYPGKITFYTRVYVRCRQQLGNYCTRGVVPLTAILCDRSEMPHLSDTDRERAGGARTSNIAIRRLSAIP